MSEFESYSSQITVNNAPDFSYVESFLNGGRIYEQIQA